MEKTLVILKPCTIQRGLIGEIISRFERKGLQLAGMKMIWLTDNILSEHYAHLKEKPFFQRIKDAMSRHRMLLGRGGRHPCRSPAGWCHQRKERTTGNHPWRLQHERTRKHRPCFRFTRNSSHRVETFFQ